MDEKDSLDYNRKTCEICGREAALIYTENGDMCRKCYSRRRKEFNEDTEEQSWED